MRQLYGSSYTVHVCTGAIQLPGSADGCVKQLKIVSIYTVRTLLFIMPPMTVLAREGLHIDRSTPLLNCCCLGDAMSIEAGYVCQHSYYHLMSTLEYTHTRSQAPL